MAFVVDTANAVIAARGGRLLDFEEVGAMTGLPLDAIFRRVWPDLTTAAAGILTDEYRAIYDAKVIPATRLFRGAGATLADFRSLGLRQATVTGKRAADAERILRGLGVTEIDLYLGGDSAALPKPAPDLALAALAGLRVDRARAVVVGDTRTDMAMGRAAGVRTIQVLWGYERRPLPEADTVVRTWPDLRRAVRAFAH